MECDWIVLCDYSFRDEGRKTCLIGTFDRIYAANVPTTHASMALAFKLLGEGKEAVKFKIEMMRPVGGQLAEMSGDATLSESGTAEFNMNLVNVQLPDFGVYAFNLHLHDRLAKSMTFSVEKPPGK